MRLRLHIRSPCTNARICICIDICTAFETEREVLGGDDENRYFRATTATGGVNGTIVRLLLAANPFVWMPVNSKEPVAVTLLKASLSRDVSLFCPAPPTLDFTQLGGNIEIWIERSHLIKNVSVNANMIPSSSSDSHV